MLASLAAAIQRTAVTVEDAVRSVDPRLALGIVVVIAISLLFRRR